MKLFISAAQFADIIGVWAPINATGRVASTYLAVDDGASEHAEAHLPGVLAADFSFNAAITFESDGGLVGADLQFRICGDGRYGVRVSPSGLTVYRQLFTAVTYINDDGSQRLASEWTWTALTGKQGGNELLLQDAGPALSARTAHHVRIDCTGSQLAITLNDWQYIVSDDNFGVGRLGLYTIRTSGSSASAVFEHLLANTDANAASNFSLLYSTAGYASAGTKRALVRSLNPLDSEIDFATARFAVVRLDGTQVLDGGIARVPDTYGMQLLLADFTALREPGTYVLNVGFTVGGQQRELSSAPFAVDERTLSRRLVRPLTVLNAQARNAADDDLRRHWTPISGLFVTGDDGALWAYGADAEAGAVLERTGTGFGTPLPDATLQSFGYTMTGEITIENGCDAQLQFGIAGDHSRSLAVTLQAGAAGGCPFGGGPGAVRLHEEGPAADAENGFRVLSSRLFPNDRPFQRGIPYAIRIVVGWRHVDVFVNGEHFLEADVDVDLKGVFGIKAWAATARFDHVAVWRGGVEFELIPVGEGRFIDRPWYGTCHCDGSLPGAEFDMENKPCTPIFAQRCGFHDCNNYIGESNSHGAFVAGLVEVWRRRGAHLSTADRRALERAIVTGVSYLGRLFDLAGGTGRYKHEDLGRGGGTDVDANGNIYTYLTLSGVYGDLSFAAKAAEIAPAVARAAMRRGWKGLRWLEQHDLAANHRALCYHLVAECARYDVGFAARVEADLGVEPLPIVERLDQMAADWAITYIDAGANVAAWGAGWRDTGQMIPVLEGVYGVWRRTPERLAAGQDGPLKTLAKFAADLLTHLENDDANAFLAIPQSSGGAGVGQNEHNWDDMKSVPRASNPIIPGRCMYNSTFFSTTVLDMVMLGQMTGESKLEKLASGHLNWVLGLNPGVPATKAVNQPASGTVWKATAFVQNLDAPYSRGFEDWHDGSSTQKDWLWGAENWTDHRETWWFDPLPNDFMTIVNGHVLWENQWDYYNTGTDGWISGETFMLNDGIYARSAVTYEDWIVGTPTPWRSVGTAFDTAGVVTNQDGRLEIIANQLDGATWHRWETAPGGSWADWSPMDWSVSSPFGLANADGRLEVFGTDRSGMLLHRWQQRPNGPFDPPHILGGPVSWATAATNADGRIEIFAVFSDSSLHHRWQSGVNAAFDVWHEMDGSARQLHLATNLDGRLELFAITPTGQLLHRWQTAPNGPFDAWHSLEASVHGVTLARNQDGRIEIFAVRDDGELIHRWQTAPNANFDSWNPMGSGFATVCAVVLGDSRIELLAVRSDHAVWRNVQSAPNRAFIGWETLGSSADRIWAITEQDGRAAVLARQLDTGMWLLRQPCVGSWLEQPC
jgi:hypothetical protein